MVKLLINNLIKILEVEYQLYEELHRLSQRKKEVIIENQVDELLQLIEEEQKELNKIAQLEEKRVETLEGIAANNSLSEGELSFKELVELIADPKVEQRLQEVRAEILDLLQELEALNNLNADLIRESLRLNDFSLQLLSSSDLIKGNTYQKPGQDKSNQQKRSIIDHKA